MSGALIRPLRKEDLSAVAALEQICFSEPWSKRTLCEAFANERSSFFVAEVAAEIAGYAGMQAVLDEGYIDNIAVAPQARRKGIGGGLLDALCAQALQNRLQFLTLEVRAGNAGAIGLYRNRGFFEVGRRKGFYRAPEEDALLMTKFYIYKEVAL